MEELNDKNKEKSDSLGNAMTIMNNLIQLTDEIDKSLSNEENGQTNKPETNPPSTSTEKESSGISFPDLPDPDKFLESITHSKVDSELSQCDSNDNPGNNIPPSGTLSQPIVQSAKILSSIAPAIPREKKNMTELHILNLASKNSQVHNFINKIKLGSDSEQDKSSTPEVVTEAGFQEATTKTIQNIKESTCTIPQDAAISDLPKKSNNVGKELHERRRSKRIENNATEADSKVAGSQESTSITPQKSAISDLPDKAHKVGEEVSSNYICTQQLIQKTRMDFARKKKQLLEARHLLDTQEVDAFLIKLDECLRKNELIEFTIPMYKFNADMILFNELVEDVKKIITLRMQVKGKPTGDTMNEVLDEITAVQNKTTALKRNKSPVKGFLTPSEQNNTSQETNVETRNKSTNSDSSNKLGTDSSSSSNTCDKSGNIQSDLEDNTKPLEHEDDEIIELEVPPKVFPLIEVPSDDEDKEAPDTVVLSDTSNIRAVPSESSDITVNPSDMPDITVIPSVTSDITVIPCDTSDITVMPSDTSDITVIPSVTSDITVIPSDSSDVTVVPSDSSNVTVVSEKTRIQNLAILNLINEVKNSRQHQETDTKACDTSPQEETSPSSSQPPSSSNATKPSVRDRLGSKVSVKDRIGPVSTDSDDTQRRAAGVSIRDRLGDRVETDEDGVLRVHIDNDLVLGDGETVETSGLLALGITSGDPVDTDRLTDVFEKVFVRQVRIETSPAREISDRNVKLDDDARSHSGSPSGFPDDVDGFQTLSEAESEVGEDMTRQRKRRSAKDRLGAREPSSGDEDRHMRRDRDHSRDRPSYSPNHRPSYSPPPPHHHHPYSSHRPPYPHRGHRPYHPRGHHPYPPRGGYHRSRPPYSSHHRPRLPPSPSRRHHSRSRSHSPPSPHSPPYSKRARYSHPSERRYSPHRSRSPRHYPRRHSDTARGRFSRDGSPRNPERSRRQRKSSERHSGSVESLDSDQPMRYSRPIDSSHHANPNFYSNEGPFNQRSFCQPNEGQFNPNPNFQPIGGQFNPNPPIQDNYNRPPRKRKFNPRNFSDHLTPRDPNIIEIVSQGATTNYEPSPIMEHQIPAGFIDPIPPPVDAMGMPLMNPYSLPPPLPPAQPPMFSLPPPPLMTSIIPPPLIPPHTPAPVPPPVSSSDSRDPSFTLNFIEDNISKVKNNLIKKVASSKSKVDEYFEKWKENEPDKRERRNSPRRNQSAQRSTGYPGSKSPASQGSARMSISPLSLSSERSHDVSNNGRRFPLPPQRTPSPPSPPRYERPSRPTRNFIDLSPLRFSRSPSLEILDSQSRRASPQRASHRRASPDRVRRPERNTGPYMRLRPTPSPPPPRSRSPLSVFGAHVTGCHGRGGRPAMAQGNHGNDTGCQGRGGRPAIQHGNHGNDTTRHPSRSRSRSPRWDVVSPTRSSSSEFGNPLDLVENPGVPGEDDF